MVKLKIGDGSFLKYLNANCKDKESKDLGVPP